MTIEPSAYTGLVTSEHNQKPNFIATLTAFVQAFVDQQNLVDGFPEDYDLDTAIGAQLDVVGQWVGLSRQVEAPIPNVYFSFDTAGLGFDQGVWFSPFDPTQGIISLDDDTYRFMLYIKIAANHWDGTLATAQQILGEIFAQSPGTIFFLVDNMDMSMDQCIAGTLPSALLLGLIQQGYVTLRPMGVQLNTVITSVDGAPLFGFDLETDAISGFDVGAWGTVTENV